MGIGAAAALHVLRCIVGMDAFLYKRDIRITHFRPYGANPALSYLTPLQPRPQTGQYVACVPRGNEQQYPAMLMCRQQADRGAPRGLSREPFSLTWI